MFGFLDLRFTRVDSNQHGESRKLRYTELELIRLYGAEQHGVKRSRVPPVPDSAEVERKKRDKQQEMIREYTGLVNELQAKVSSLRSRCDDRVTIKSTCSSSSLMRGSALLE